MTTESEPVTAESLASLVAGHREFLAYVERRVHDRALAEEIVQDALVKSLDHVGEINESAIGWFYRVLRNATIDHLRKQATKERNADQLVAEIERASEPDPDLHRTI